jgi:methylthioribulose-1-phosphate dehydratase
MDDEHPKRLIPELCRQFYHLGWVTGEFIFMLKSHS